MDDAALLERQDALQLAADHAVADLDLDRLLRQAGEPVRVGSSALGLMTWPDLDVTVVCPRLSVGLVAAMAAELAVHPCVREVVVRNDTGRWNVDPGYPDGVYLGLAYRCGAGLLWKVDVWFVDEPDLQPDLEHVRTLPARLDARSRLAILRIKDSCADRPDYRSVEVYTAVLDAGVQTPEEFQAWRAGRST